MPDSGNRSQLEVISAIYGAAENPGTWPQALELLSRRYDSHCFSFLRRKRASSAVTLLAQGGLSETQKRDYVGHYGAISPLFQQARHYPQGHVYSDSFHPHRQAYLDSEAYVDFFAPAGIDHLLSVCPAKDDQHAWAVIFRRDRQAGPYRPSEIEDLAQLTPHLRKSLSLHNQMEALRTDLSRAQKAMSGLGFGIILLDAEGQIASMNAAAERLLARENSELTYTARRLRAWHGRDRQALQAALTNALAIAETGSAPAPDGLRMTTREYTTGLTLLFHPLCDDRTHGLHQGKGVAVYLIDGSVDHDTAISVLQALHELTPRQAEVALLVHAGNTLQQISERLGLSRETIKSHVTSICARMGVNRQAELVREITRVLWMIEG